MYSNIYFDRYKSEIHLWEYSNGTKVHRTYPAPLYFFVESDEDESDYKTIYGKKAKKIEFQRWGQYRKKVEQYKEWNVKMYESDVPVETKFVIDHYLGIDLTVPDFDIHYLDIEVHSEEGFPRPEDAKFPITIITTWSTKHQKYIIFAEKDFDDSFIKAEGEDCKKYIYNDEADMLEAYMGWVKSEHPDILTGWNSNGYDIPYIMNRSKVLFGESGPSKISPIDYTNSRIVPITEYRMEERWSIGGISLIDMLDVYKNYTFSEQESWKLDYIAEVELGEKKVEYDGSLADLYNNEWQKYCEYNVQDVRLLKKLENKKKFLNLLFTFCYGCRVPFEHYDRTTRVLDGAFISALAAENIVLPDADPSKKDSDEQFIGGFVRIPEAGLREWVVSFDATSLYPSIMMGWNISPETKVGKIPQQYVKDMMLCMSSGKNRDNKVSFSGERVTCGELCDFIKESNFCIAANGVVYRQDKQGIIPKFVEEWFLKRKEYKKKMIEAQQVGDKNTADVYHLLQLNYKILINSVFGFLGTPYSRFYDYDNAVAVTMTGRYVTITTGNTIESHFKSDKWMNSKFNPVSTTDKTVIYCDTDSCVSDTNIRLPDGSTKTIEKLFEDEIDIDTYKVNIDGREFVFPKKLELPYFDETDKQVKSGKVKYIEKHLVNKPIFRIKTKSGNFVDVTQDHTCMVIDDNGSLIETKPEDMKNGDKSITIDKKLSNSIDYIDSVEFIEQEEQYVYDIGMCDTPHTFFANDILVHNSVYLDYGRIFQSMDYDYNSKTEDSVKNFIIYGQEKENNELGIDYAGRDDLSDDEVAEMISKAASMEESADSIQNYVSDLINNAMEHLSVRCFNTKVNKISFKREAVASRGIFMSKKKRYALWVLNNEGVELPEKKRFKVTGGDLVSSTTPPMVKQGMRKVIIDMLRFVDRDYTVEQLKELHDKFWESTPEQIAFSKTANNITKFSERREREGTFKSTPQQVRASILYNEMLDDNPKLKRMYDKIYDGDKMSYMYAKVGPNWKYDVIAFKDRWTKDLDLEQYIDRRKQCEVSLLTPVRRFFDLLDWSMPDFEKADMKDMFEWD